MKKKSQYHCTYEQFEKHSEKIFNKMRMCDNNLTWDYNSTTDKSVTHIPAPGADPNKPYGTIFVEIGTKSLRKNMKNGLVRDDDFVNTICSEYHELGHIILRTKAFTKGIARSNIIQAAKVSVASRFFEEYYTMGYPNNPEEIMCEIYAFKSLEKHFKKNPISPDVNWKGITISDISNRPFMNNALDVSLKRNINTYENMIRAYEYKLQLAFNRKRINDGIFEKQKFSEAFYELLDNDVLLDIVNAPTGFDEIEILNDYISKNHPEYFKGYTCLESIYDIKYPDNTVSKTNTQQTLKSKNAQQTSSNKRLNIQSTPKLVGTPTIDSEPESPGTYSDGKPMPKPAPESQNKDNNEFTL